ncbi:MAG: glycosyltransferase family 4 protein, partial [Halobacteriaceae archaeon]
GMPFAPKFLVRLNNVVKRINPDVLHTHYPLPLYPEAATLVARWNDIPLVITAHGALEMGIKSPIAAFGAVYNRSLLHFSLRSADAIHVSNRHIPEKISVYQQYKQKIESIPMGVDIEWFD